LNKVLALCLSLSVAVFAHIKPGSLSVKSGTVWTSGQVVSLSWSASIDHNKSSYTLWYSPDSGKTWNTVKTGIPGQAAGVAVVYSWTVPTEPTTKGMIRVFQVFGGTVATNPSNPGDYTLFSPVFTIKAATGVAHKASPVPERAAVRVVGKDLVVGFAGLPEGRATLEILDLAGAVRGRFDLGSVTGASPNATVRAIALGRSGPSIARLLIEGVPVARTLVAPLP